MNTGLVAVGLSTKQNHIINIKATKTPAFYNYVQLKPARIWTSFKSMTATFLIKSYYTRLSCIAMHITGNYAYFASTTLYKQDDISRDDGLLCARVTEPSMPQSTISDVTNVKT